MSAEFRNGVQSLIITKQRKQSTAFGNLVWLNVKDLGR